MKHIGFSGTQWGMSPAQLECFRELIGWGNGRDDWFHHGDCIGADAQAHRIAQKRGWRVHLHPPIDPRKRAWCEGSALTEPEAPYMRRNAVIVAMVQELYATPQGPESANPYSGTWATIRRAQKKLITVTIIWPDGTIEYAP